MEEEKNKKIKRGKVDYTLIFIVIFLIGFGLVMLYSTSSYMATLEQKDGLYYLKRQLKSLAVGLAAMIVVSMIPYKFYLKARLYLVAMAVAIASVLLVLTPLGHDSHGATRWIYIGDYSIQPAEICKVCVIVFMAAMLSKMSKSVRKCWKGFWIPMLPVGIVCLLILFVTKNLSSAIIIGLIAVTMVAVAESKNIWPPITYIGFVAICVIAVLLVVSGKLPAKISYRFERILAWLDPNQYADGTGLQTLQSLYGIGSGGIFGKGLGKSMQKLGSLPEANNDMIFSIICEELGLFGGIAVIMMYVLLLFRLKSITNYCEDAFGNLLVTGVFCNFALQVIMNIGVATNSIPNTGVSLPFISYGGSSVIFLLIEIGLVLSVSRYAVFTPPKPESEESDAKTD